MRRDAKRALRSAALRGVASVLDLAGDPSRPERRRVRLDAESLSRDARAVGRDLWTAVRSSS